MAAPVLSVDVRDMLCAQALALTSQALERLQRGQAAEILYDAADVKRDLLVWARERGHSARAHRPGALRVAKR
ncbi:MAG: sulfurtransferase TusA family protein [Candidatus Omnitrophota bacterium]|nr:sulfurtransferase TusA family protein [Candidatus Omnitrophota bacterium]